MVRILVTRGFADVNAHGVDGMTPLMSTIRRRTFYVDELGPPAIARFLLGYGALVDVRDNLGCTALHYSAETGYPEIIRSLAELGADVNAQDGEGLTPLHYVAQQFDYVAQHIGEKLGLLLDSLLSHGANPFIPNFHGQSAHYLLCETEAGRAYMLGHPQYFNRDAHM